jgi:hypothetical protein
MSDDSKPAQYARYALGEILLVVVGILIALQINNWNEDKNTRRIERKLLRELKTDLEETEADLVTDMEKALVQLKVTDSLYQEILKIRDAKDPRPIHISMKYIFNRSDLFPKKSAYESLKAFGINLVSSDSLRKGVTDLYELQLVRVDGLETYIKEILEHEFVPYLIKVSKPTHEREDFTSLKEQFSSDSPMSYSPYQFNAPNLISNFYQIDSPGDELLHLLKTKYLAYMALTGLYNATQTKIDALISAIDAETGP